MYFTPIRHSFLLCKLNDFYYSSGSMVMVAMIDAFETLAHCFTSKAWIAKIPLFYV